VLALVLATVPGLAAADSRVGGSVVVGPDETISGNLEAIGGSVTIYGTVNGDLTVVAGSVRIDGTVTGDVSGTAGSVVVGQDAQVNSLDLAAGDVRIDGTVTGDATVAGETITLGPTAQVGGAVRYDGTLIEESGSVVSGPIVQESAVQVGPVTGVTIPGWIPTVYFAAVGLLAAVVLLALFPRFSDGVAQTAVSHPLRSGGAGLLALIGVPIGLVLIALTIVGIPLTIVGALAFGIGVWVGSLYGRYAIGTWLLGYAGRDNRWLALLVGLVVVTIAVAVPIIGGVVEFVVTLLGLGALSITLLQTYRGTEPGEVAPGTETEPDETSSPPA
jgi:cytoskeletal protein CcmA (bactofilin family)